MELHPPTHKRALPTLVVMALLVFSLQPPPVVAALAPPAANHY